jgi:hypothetical protein
VTGHSLVDAEIERILSGLDSVIEVAPEVFYRHVEARHSAKFEVLRGPARDAFLAFRGACERGQRAAAAALDARDAIRKSIEDLGRVLVPPPETK